MDCMNRLLSCTFDYFNIIINWMLNPQSQKICPLKMLTFNMIMELGTWLLDWGNKGSYM